jgi:hypothetical protein
MHAHSVKVVLHRFRTRATLDHLVNFVASAATLKSVSDNAETVLHRIPQCLTLFGANVVDLTFAVRRIAMSFSHVLANFCFHITMRREAT